jgi:F-type H+-transporting ATPase subunit b
VQIDLFTLGAQVVNFLVLVGLLRYFLYDRVIEAMDAREDRIASRIREAEERLKSAEQEKTSYQEKQDEWEKKRERMIREAREEVDRQQQEWMDDARDEVDASRRRWMDELEQQRDEFLQQLRRRIGEKTVAVARRALADLADADLEDQVIETFTERLQDLEEDDRSKIAAADVWKIRSAFELSDKQRERLEDVLKEAVGESRAIEYSTAEEIIGGVELRFDGEAVTWNLRHYLDRLEQQVRDVLREAAEPQREEDGVEAGEASEVPQESADTSEETVRDSNEEEKDEAKDGAS